MIFSSLFIVLLLLCVLIPNSVNAGCNSYNPKLTNIYGFFWGSASIGSAGVVNVGDVIRAYADSVKTNGGCVGVFKVKEPNYYGSMAIYADDQTTPEKDGVSEGDVIHFTICHEGKEYLCHETSIWDTGYINDHEKFDISASVTVINAVEEPEEKGRVKNTNSENIESPSLNPTVSDKKQETIVGHTEPSVQNQTVSGTAQGVYRTSITRFSGGSGEEALKKNQRVKALTNIPPASSPAQKSVQVLNQEGYSGKMQQPNNMRSTNEEGKENDKKNSGLIIIPKEYVVSESPQPIKEQGFDTSGLRMSLYNQYGEIPIITESFPKDGDILPTKEISAIKLFFNQSMENGTVEKSFTVTPKVEGRFEWKNRLSELDFIPSASLSPGVSYVICITDKAKDVYGRPLDGNRDGNPEGDFCLTFKTEEMCEKTDVEQEGSPISPHVSRCFITTLQ